MQEHNISFGPIQGITEYKLPSGYKNELDNQTLDFIERKNDLELNDIYGY